MSEASDRYFQASSRGNGVGITALHSAESTGSADFHTLVIHVLPKLWRKKNYAVYQLPKQPENLPESQGVLYTQIYEQDTWHYRNAGQPLSPRLPRTCRIL